MKNENGVLTFSDKAEEELVVTLMQNSVKSALETAGLTKPIIPPGVAGAGAKIAQYQFEARPNETKRQANLRCKQALDAFAEGKIKVDELPKEARAIKYFRALYEGDVPTVKAMSEGSTYDGSYLIPVEFSNDLKVAIEIYSAIKDCEQHDMKTNTLDLNTITTKPIVYQVAEKTAPTEAAPKTARPILTAYAFAGVLVITRELWDDTNITNFYQRMIDLFAEQFAARQEYELFVGSTFTGVFGSATPVTTTLTSVSIKDIKYKNVVDVANSLSPGKLGTNAKFYMHRTTFGYIQQMTDSNNRPIVLNPWDAKERSLLGFPVVLSEAITNAATVSSAGVTLADPTDAAATAYIAFGNLKWCDFGLRQDLSAEVYKEGTIASVNLAEQRSKGIVIDMRFAIQVAIPGNLAIVKTAAN